MPDDNADLSGKLTFENDKGAGRSKWIAVLLALLLGGWMGSGFVAPNETEEVAEEEREATAIAVAVLDSSAQDIDLVLTAEGQSAPDRSTQVQANASGQIISVSVERGELVTAGQELGRLDSETAEAQLQQAETQFAQAESDLERVTKLLEDGITTENQLTQTRSAYAAAEAALIAARERVDDSIIRAPFAGRLNEMTLDVGELVNPGEVVAEILDNDPLTVVAQVPQQALSRLQKDQPAQVAFITGEVLPGVVGFIGSNADTQTRTFRVEVIVENPDSLMPAGLSAQIAVPTGQARGHFISPAILSLGTSGELGVKTVVEGNKVAFENVSIVRAQTDGVWITGLPEEARIITIGQGFVTAGDIVDPNPVEDGEQLVAKQ